MKTRALVLAAVAALVLLGCEARSLSTLQTEFSATVANERQCKGSSNIDPTGNCTVDFDQIYADIAAQAEASANEYDADGGIKIGLWRLHAFALWQSVGDENEKAVVDAARKGLDACAEATQDAAPRDCALLTTVGTFVANESLDRRVTEVGLALEPSANRKEVCAERAATWLSLARRLESDTYLPLADHVRRAARNGSVPASAVEYLRDQLEKTEELASKLGFAGRQCVRNTDDADTVRNCPCEVEGRGTVESCAKVAGNEVLGFYHEAFCASQDVFKRQECPCDYRDRGEALTDQESLACDHVQGRAGAARLHEAHCAVEERLTVSIQPLSQRASDQHALQSYHRSDYFWPRP